MSFTYRTTPARPDWTADGASSPGTVPDKHSLRVAATGDSGNALLTGNALEQRFRELGAGDFIIGETGFGDGRNFLASCLLWSRTAAADARLHYIASETRPLRKPDLQRGLAAVPELAALAADLLRQLPDHTTGTHQLALRHGDHRIRLTLLHEEDTSAFGALAAEPRYRVDAWFLGSCPQRDEAAPTDIALLRHLAALSHAGTTLASRSVDTLLLQHLAVAGFACAVVRGSAGADCVLQAHFTDALRSAATVPRSGRSVCIIGGGLAGCSTAHALAAAGWQVTLLEQGPQLAMGASGNPQGILHFKPGTVDAPDNRFNLHAYLHAARHYRSLGLAPEIWSACGMLQLAHDDKLLKRFDTLARSGLYAPEVLQVLDSEAASALSGESLSRPALYFPEAGWLCPPRLCAWYCAQPGIEVLTSHTVTAVEVVGDSWTVQVQDLDGAHSLQVDHVVVCNSTEAGRFDPASRLPLISNRGQVDLYAIDAAHDLPMVICGQGYLVPAGADGQAVGGSFFLGPDDAPTREQNRRQHLQQLAGINPDLARRYAAVRPLQQRVSERCTLPGRMPVVGALGPSGLWINVGHGSHGLARTPLCAALLASLMSGTPAPLAPQLLQLLSPGRFLEA